MITAGNKKSEYRRKAAGRGGVYCAYENTVVCRYAFCVSMNKISYTLLFNISVKITCCIQISRHKIFNMI